jgi:hypothetical protein
MRKDVIETHCGQNEHENQPPAPQPFADCSGTTVLVVRYFSSHFSNRVGLTESAFGWWMTTAVCCLFCGGGFSGAFSYSYLQTMLVAPADRCSRAGLDSASAGMAFKLL